MKKIIAIILCSISFIICGCFSDDIPGVPGKLPILNIDFNAYKIRHSRNLYGPDENIAIHLTSNCFLTNIDDLYLYDKSGYDSGFFGVKDNKVHFYTHYVSNIKYVKDFLPNSALKIYPKRYKLLKDHDYEAFVWEFDNGYLALHVITIPNWEFYNQIVKQVVYVKNKKYLHLQNPI